MSGPSDRWPLPGRRRGVGQALPSSTGISAARGAATGTRPALRGVLLAISLGLVLSACGSSQATARSDGAIVTVTCPVPDAVVWVDGRYVAQVRDLRGGLALEPGRHQVEVRHERYHATYREISVARGQRLRLELDLAEALP